MRALEVTTSNVGDARMLPESLDQIPADQTIRSVTTDGAYDTGKCHDAIAARGSHAVIPPSKNGKPWKPTSAGALAIALRPMEDNGSPRNEAVNASRYFGRVICRRWSGYHHQSRVETKIHCVKLLGQSLMARDFNRQVAEIQILVAVLDRCTALGIPVTKPIG
mgnify:CR=1 FL=1